MQERSTAVESAIPTMTLPAIGHCADVYSRRWQLRASGRLPPQSLVRGHARALDCNRQPMLNIEAQP